jgi:hypothetical protein
MMEAERSSEMSIHFHQAKQGHIPEDRSFLNLLIFPVISNNVPFSTQWDACVLLHVILHGRKGKLCLAQVQSWAFKMKITPTVNG